MRADAESYVAHTLNAKGGAGRIDGESETFITHALRADGFDASEDGTGRGTPIVVGTLCKDTFSGGAGGRPEGAAQGHFVAAIQERAICENPDAGPDGAGFRDDGAAYTLEARTVPQAVCFHENQRAETTLNDTAGSLKIGGGKPGQGYPATMIGSAVRRLTPRECERLQGFPDDYTLVQYRGKPAVDGPRYKSLGNSMAVPVMRWILSRIEKSATATDCPTSAGRKE